MLTRLTLALMLFAPPAAGAQSPADAAAVRALVDRYVSARDARDPAAVGALFTADADQYTTTGDWRRGRAAVVTGTASSTQRNPGQRRIDIEAIRFVTPGVAIVDGRYVITGDDTQRWTTIVAAHTADGWRIAAIRNISPTGGVGSADR
jgi:uncharacterized protein (TIGR02246 family)